MNRQFALWALVAALALSFLLFRSQLDFAYVIPRRAVRLAAMILGGLCVAWSSIVFQTLTGNRILTPAVMGFEAVYLLLQALLLGSVSLVLLGEQGNFLLSVLVLLMYAWALQRWLLRDGVADVYFLLLFGLVLSLVIGTFTQFIQIRISPGEFSILQGFSQAGFTRAQPAQLLIAGALVIAVCAFGVRQLAILDVLSLGRDQATSLGIDQPRSLRLNLALIAVLVAVSTSLMGPTAFMGIFVANITYALSGTFRHRVTLLNGSAVAIALFIGAQLLVEQVFNNRTTVSILINLLCAAFFLVLMVRARSQS